MKALGPSKMSIVVFAVSPILAVLGAFTALILKSLLSDWEVFFYGVALLLFISAIAIHIVGTRRVLKLIDSLPAHENAHTD